MALKTYGKKPISFQLEKNGEYYCLGSHVVRYLRDNCFYQKYSDISKRRVTTEYERRKLIKFGLYERLAIARIILLRASEVEDIIGGNGDKYKTELQPSGDKPLSFQLEKNGEYYCLSSHVRRYLGTKNIFKKYPGIFKRRIRTENEKKKVVELGLCEKSYTTYVVLLRASEVKDIIEGNVEKYKTAFQPSGDKPISFQLERNGEYYCFGLHVIKYLGNKDIYKRYPGMFKRHIRTKNETDKLVKLGLSEKAVKDYGVLLRASEVEDIIEGNVDKYKTALQPSEDKPMSFQLEKNGEYYCLGPHVRRYLGIVNLYKRYPGIFKRRISTENEKNQLVKLGLYEKVSAPGVVLLRASEVKDIIEGNGDKYKTDSSIYSTEPVRKCKDRRSMPSATTSSHLDALPPARQINRKRLHDEKVRTLSPCCDDRNPSENMKTAEQQEISMPLSSDEEIEARRSGDISIWNNNAKRVSRETVIETQMEVDKTEGTVNSPQLEATHNQKCRLCLKNCDQFLELFQNDILPLTITAFASVKIKRGDGLPSVICVSCRQLLDISYNFKCQVERSDTTLRALSIYSSLSNEIGINHNEVKESLELVMRNKSQLSPLQNNNHQVSSDYDNRQDSVAREINKECMSCNNHSHNKGPEDNNKDNELDNEKPAEKGDNSNESEIIPMFNRSEVLLEDASDDGVTVSQSLQSMEYESEPMKKEELLLPEGSDVSTEKDIHHEAETELRYTCYWCAKQFSDIAELMNHVTNNHESLNNENRVDIDNNCGRVETDREPDKLDKDIGGSIDTQKVDKNNCKFKCTICVKEFTYQKSFLSHIKTHLGHKESGTSDNHFGRLEKTKESWKHPNNLLNSKMNESDDNNSPIEGLQCIQCGIVFPTERILRRHISTHNDVRFNCLICAKEFQYLDVLKDHQRSKHKGKIFGTSGDRDYDTVDERRKETECRPHERAMCPKVPTLND